MSEYNFYLKTVQSSAFRTLIDAIKEIVADCNIVFDEKGILIKTVDESYNAMVHLRLDASKFEEYNCNGKFIVGVALLNLHKLFKTMSSTDVLALYQYKSEPNKLEIRIENNKKAKMTRFKLHLLDLKIEKISGFQPEFQQAISIESTELHKIIREMRDISQQLEIRCHDKTLRFSSVNGSFASAEVFLTIKNTKQNLEITQGIFNLKYLSLFSKCTPLSKTVNIYLKNDFPLIVEYFVNDLGSIKLILMMSEKS